MWTLRIAWPTTADIKVGTLMISQLLRNPCGEMELGVVDKTWVMARAQ